MKDAFLIRRAQVQQIAAEKAYQSPLLASGFWTHNDIRDNVWLALHGMVYLYESGAVNYREKPEFQLCEKVLFQALALQDIDPNSETYGHWPLGLADNPADSKVNTLPVELMGSLLIFFRRNFLLALSESLIAALDKAVQHIYQSDFYRQPVRDFGHHEAKYTASKLLLGHIYQDEAIFQLGYADLLATIQYLQQNGFREYGALPWFWHWVQAFTCAWEVIEDAEIRSKLEEILELLWRERAHFYIGGAWAGPHSRVLEHDVPEDLNVLHDYIQFGDFVLPKAIPRLEGAGLFHYRVSESINQLALENEKSVELFKKINLTSNSLHTYLYKTKNYIIGGMWERREEYMNEQHRWDITLPSRSGGNQAFFFQPGEGWSDNDPRHEGGRGEVIYHKNAVLSVYPVKDRNENKLIGILPSGQWHFNEAAGYGLVDQVYIRFHLQNAFTVSETTTGYYLQSEGDIQAVAIEVLELEEAAAAGINNLAAFTAASQLKKPVIQKVDNGNDIQLFWETIVGNILKLSMDASGKLSFRAINGTAVDFKEYEV